ELKLGIHERLRVSVRTPRASLPPRWRSKLRPPLPVGAELVVVLSFLRVAQDLVSLVDFLEFLLGGFFVLRNVRMVLAREFAKGLANLLLACRALDAQTLVIILKLDSHSSNCGQPAWRRQRPQFTRTPDSFNPQAVARVGSGTGVPPVRIVQPTHGRDARATSD